MRPIELFTLEATQIDLDGRWISLDKSKTGEPRGVPLHEFLVALFRSLLAKHKGILFLSHKGEPYPPSDDFGGQISGAIEGASPSGRPFLSLTTEAQRSPLKCSARHRFSHELLLKSQSALAWSTISARSLSLRSADLSFRQQ